MPVSFLLTPYKLAYSLARRHKTPLRPGSNSSLFWNIIPLHVLFHPSFSIGLPKTEGTLFCLSSLLLSSPSSFFTLVLLFMFLEARYCRNDEWSERGREARRTRFSNILADVIATHQQGKVGNSEEVIINWNRHGKRGLSVRDSCRVITQPDYFYRNRERWKRNFGETRSRHLLHFLQPLSYF